MFENQTHTNDKVQNVVQFEQVFNKIVQKIVLHRKDAKLTQEQLAKILQIDRRKIIALEAGMMDVDTMLKAADLLGIDVKLNFEIN